VKLEIDDDVVVMHGMQSRIGNIDKSKPDVTSTLNYIVYPHRFLNNHAKNLM